MRSGSISLYVVAGIILMSGIAGSGILLNKGIVGDGAEGFQNAIDTLMGKEVATDVTQGRCIGEAAVIEACQPLSQAECNPSFGCNWAGACGPRDPSTSECGCVGVGDPAEICTAVNGFDRSLAEKQTLCRDELECQWITPEDEEWQTEGAGEGGDDGQQNTDEGFLDRAVGGVDEWVGRWTQECFDGQGWGEGGCPDELLGGTDEWAFQQIAGSAEGEFREGVAEIVNVEEVEKGSMWGPSNVAVIITVRNTLSAPIRVRGYVLDGDGNLQDREPDVFWTKIDPGEEKDIPGISSEANLKWNSETLTPEYEVRVRSQDHEIVASQFVEFAGFN